MAIHLHLRHQNHYNSYVVDGEEIYVKYWKQLSEGRMLFLISDKLADELLPLINYNGIDYKFISFRNSQYKDWQIIEYLAVESNNNQKQIYWRNQLLLRGFFFTSFSPGGGSFFALEDDKDILFKAEVTTDGKLFLSKSA